MAHVQHFVEMVLLLVVKLAMMEIPITKMAAQAYARLRLAAKAVCVEDGRFLL